MMNPRTGAKTPTDECAATCQTCHGGGLIGTAEGGTTYCPTCQKWAYPRGNSGTL